MIMPGITTYAATKRHLTYMSEGLNYELRGKIDVLCWEPLGVSTNMMEEPPSGFTISSEKAASDIMKHIGKERNTKGNFRHALHYWLMPSTKYWLFKYLIHSKTNSEHKKRVAEGK